MVVYWNSKWGQTLTIYNEKINSVKVGAILVQAKVMLSNEPLDALV
jgi:hypothetical protein